MMLKALARGSDPSPTDPSPRNDLHIGLEAVYRSDWPAGLIYIRNIVYALAALGDDAPRVRLLPLDVGSYREIKDLQRLPFVEVAAIGGHDVIRRGGLLVRKATRRIVQPRLGRALAPAFRRLDLTYPAWGTAIPGTPQVHWIPDLQHVHLPYLFSAEELAARERWVAEVAALDGSVIFSSEAALHDMLEVHPHPKVTTWVWRFCTTLTEQELNGRDPRAAFSLPETYLYVGNQFWAHKDHLTLFKALAILRGKGIRPTLVCTGRLEDYRDPAYVESVISFLRDHALEDQVMVLGFLDRNDQIQVLRHAAALVQPSRFEGWGTVVEDAKAIGRPVVLSDITVHKEQADGSVPFHFFETGSEEALAEVLESLFRDLRPGPDPISEASAAEAAQRRQVHAGKEFVRIASSIVSGRDAGSPRSAP